MLWPKPIAKLLVALAFLLPAPLAVLSQEPANALQNIQLIPLKDYERIELIFANNYTQPPIVDFDAGFIFLRLNATSIGVPTRQYVFPESSQLVKAVRATQNQNSTLVEIILKAPNLSLENKVKIAMNGQRLWVDLDRRVTPSPSSASAPSDISQEVEQRLRTDELTAIEPDATNALLEAEPAIAPPLEDNWMMTLITLILSLLLIFVVLFLVLFLYKKLFFGRLPALEGKFKIRTVSTFHIGPKQKVIVLEVGTQHFACGVTANNITFLAEIGHAQDQSFLQNVSVQDEEIHFNVHQARANFLKTMEATQKKSPPKQQSQPSAQSKPAPSAFEGILQEETRSQIKRTETASPPKKPHVLPDKGVQKEASPAEIQPTPPATKSFDTPVLPEVESSPFLEEHLGNDTSLQQFAKKLSSRLKMLKPIE